MKVKIILCATMGMLFFATTATAQNVTVTGFVRDFSTGEGIPFVSVMVKGTMVGVSSNSEGNYSISTHEGETLVFSAIGYLTEEVAVDGKSKIDVLLSEDTQAIEQSVVVGYGTSKKISSLVGSVQIVNASTVKNAPSASALDNLQGQVAGLAVLTTSGVAGDDSVSMTLHGVGSLGTSPTPLYIIDGVPSSSGAVLAMNPNDIENISVLKDASATSIYGSRAANGVIYITTKAGGFSEKASITGRFQYGTSTLASTRLYENMMSGEELKDFWVSSGLHTADWIRANYTDKGYDHDTKWYKYIMNLWTPQMQSDLTVQGGSEKVSYYVSASQFSQKGYSIGNWFNRYTVRANVQASPTKWFKTGVNVNFSIDKAQQNPSWGSMENGRSNDFSGGLSFMLNPLYSPYDENGKEVRPRVPGLNIVNPYYYMECHDMEVDRYGLNGSVFVSIVPVQGLTLSSRVGVDGYFNLNGWHTLASYADAVGSTAEAGQSTTFNYQATVTNTAEYIWNIADGHKLTFLLGQEGIAYKYFYYFASSSGQTDDRMMQVQQGLQSTFYNYESQTQYRFLSFFAHVDYTLLDRYYFDVVVRNDASSRFGSAHRNAQFWSAGAKWSMKKEAFLKNTAQVNALDLKVSYGTQGNAEIGNYASIGIIGDLGTYEDINGKTLTQPSNERLSWEKQSLLTVGVTARLFNLLDVNAEYYYRKTTSMLMDVPVPYTTGFTSVTNNVGSMRNTGVDLAIGVDILRGRDYFLRFGTTFNYNGQKVLSLFDGRDRWQVASTYTAYVVGSPVMFYCPVYAGVDPQDGKPMWYVPGDDVDKTAKGATTKTFDNDALTQNTGKPRYAPASGGFSLSGAWKGLSLQADFSYVAGKYMLNRDKYYYANPVGMDGNNQIKDVRDFWTEDNRNAKWPDWSAGAVMQMDSNLLENASFLRLKNLQAGYSLPQSVLQWSGGVLKGVKVTFTGRNLLTFTKYTGIDPEVNSNQALGIGGNTKQFLGGIELTF